MVAGAVIAGRPGRARLRDVFARSATGILERVDADAATVLETLDGGWYAMHGMLTTSSPTHPISISANAIRPPAVKANVARTRPCAKASAARAWRSCRRYVSATSMG
ncbi:hypothetical protein ACN8ZM_35070 [Burkholderia aenigmatica]|uniref:hypothetical protein n=1 Tax=Burkholderia aenigmatica TaxID=2015348 RepID=UPI003B42BD5F